ncbi:Ku protein [Epidermidibacterium keratini]|uniref:Non-homologous end joining protein Ku n=1 Tax=Epidermidibacterium keratini TaxID=1891644 RepID=A0A7L4YM41_9ACTN|nr:Ku protein [Epidermidibacterium keratini]QHB99942.1 Ku protein [Epidermidibacterium keratini]
MRSIWKGSIAFGLVNVPVKLYSATESHDAPLHQVHTADGGRIRYQRKCEVCGNIVTYDEISRAYIDGDETVMLTSDDFAALPVEKSREIEVVEFVPREQVDLMLYSSTYYLEPDSKSPKAYVLLREALEETDRLAIVKFALRQRTRLAALRVRGDVLVMQTLLWPDEVREPEFEALDDDVTIGKMELQMASQLIESLSEDFEPEKFTDDYQAQLQRLIEAKIEKGDTLVAEDAFDDEEGEGDDSGDVIDLMEALRRSVGKKRGTDEEDEKKPAKKTAAKKAAKKAPAKRAPAKKTAKKTTKKTAAKKSAAS